MGGGLKKQAFTLIELLAVIVILGVIALIATPIILKILGNVRKETWRDTAYGIVDSAKMYYTEKILSNPVSEEVTFNFDNGKPEGLQFSGTVPDGGIVKVNEKGFTSIAVHNEEWCATKGYNESKVELKKYEEGNCIDAEIAKDPMITLKGNEEDQIGKGQTYVDPGATARTVDGTPLSYQTEITKNGEKVSSIDTSKVGDTYKITYTAESNGKKASVNRTVTVIDMTPVISFTEANPNYVKSQNVAILVSAIRPNTIDKFTYQIDEEEVVEVNGTNTVITLNETGEHRIKVTVRDNKGYEATKTSNVYKIDATGPIITLNPETVTLKVNEVASYHLYNGVSAIDNVDGPITINSDTTKVEGSLSASVGTQKITYIVKDKLGNESRKERTFNITQADAPVLNFSSICSNNLWIGSTKITATASDIDNLTAFSYSINGGTETSVAVNGKSASVEIPLSSTGTYTIKIKATGSYQNSAELSSGTYKIDTTKPTVSNLTASTAWSTSNKITGTGTDSHSGISYYAVTTNSNVPTSWTSVTNTSSYSISYNATSNGTYYVWVKDKVGNYNYGTVTVSRVDNVAPTITARNTPYTATVGTSYATTNFYTVSYGPSGGSTVCRNGSTTITNVNSLGVGSYTLTCTATSTAGKSASVNVGVTIKSPSYVYYTTYRTNTSNMDLYRCNDDGSNCVFLQSLAGHGWTGGSYMPIISVSANYLYYTTHRTNTSEMYLYRCNLDGSNCTIITTLKSYLFSGGLYRPVVSAGSNYLYYTTNTSSNLMSLYRCNADGSNCVYMTNLSGNGWNGGSYTPVVSVGNNYMYYTSYSSNGIMTLYRCNADGSNCSSNKSLSGNGWNGGSYPPLVSVGNSYMYYTTYTGSGTMYLYRCNADGNNCTNITTLSGNGWKGGSYPPLVSVGSNYMYYTTYNGSGYMYLYRCSLEGTNCTNIKTLSGNGWAGTSSQVCGNCSYSPVIATN